MGVATGTLESGNSNCNEQGDDHNNDHDFNKGESSIFSHNIRIFGFRLTIIRYDIRGTGDQHLFLSSSQISEPGPVFQENNRFFTGISWFHSGFHVNFAGMRVESH